jgi:acyl-CoA thioester hydrolase
MPVPTPVLVPIEVRWRDLDPMGHVNNAVYFSYLEHARIGYARALLPDAEPLDATRPLARAFQFIIASASCDFRSPALLGEPLVVAVYVSRVGHKSFVFDYRLTVGDTGRLVAEGRSTQVWYDYIAGHSLAVPAEMVALMEKLQGAPISRAI